MKQSYQDTFKSSGIQHNAGKMQPRFCVGLHAQYPQQMPWKLQPHQAFQMVTMVTNQEGQFIKEDMASSLVWLSLCVSI